MCANYRVSALQVAVTSTYEGGAVTWHYQSPRPVMALVFSDLSWAFPWYHLSLSVLDDKPHTLTEVPTQEEALHEDLMELRPTDTVSGREWRLSWQLVDTGGLEGRRLTWQQLLAGLLVNPVSRHAADADDPLPPLVAPLRAGLSVAEVRVGLQADLFESQAQDWGLQDVGALRLRELRAAVHYWDEYQAVSCVINCSASAHYVDSTSATEQSSRQQHDMVNTCAKVIVNLFFAVAGCWWFQAMGCSN
eukprot:scaffold323120_cov40-Prasinocladus_malaysianus.AAC.1